MAFNFSAIVNLFGTSTLNVLNSNFQAVKNEFAKVFYADGSVPMSSEFDMDTNEIINLKDGQLPSSAATVRQLYTIPKGERGLQGISAEALARTTHITAYQGQTVFPAGFTFNPVNVYVSVNGYEIGPDGYTVNATNDGIVTLKEVDAGTTVTIRNFLPSNNYAFQPYTAEFYGAKGDGVSDDTAAWLRLAQAVNASSSKAIIENGSSIYLISDVISFSQNVTLKNGQFLFASPGSQLMFNINTDDEYIGQQVVLQGVDFVAGGTQTAAPVEVRCLATVYGTSRQFTATDCTWRGVNGHASFPSAVSLRNISYPTFFRCTFTGDRLNQPRLSNGIDSLAEPGFDKGDIEILRCTFFFLNTAAKISGHQEGNKFNDNTIVSCLKGVDWQADADQAEPLFTCNGNHFNCEQQHIILRRIIQANITNNNFYAQGADGTATEAHCIDWQSGNGPGMQGTILGNVFYLLGSFAPITIACFIQSGDGTTANVIIDHNLFQGATFGIYSDILATQYRIGMFNVFENCTTNIQTTNPNGSVNCSDAAGNFAIGASKIDPDARWYVAGAIKAKDGYQFGNKVAQFSGSAPPSGVISAPPGSTYHQGDTSSGTLGAFWIKTSGTDTTGWARVQTI